MLFTFPGQRGSGSEAADAALRESSEMSFASLWLASTSIARRYIARRGASQWGGWAYPPIGVTVPCGRGTRAFSLKHNRDHLGQGEIFLRQHRRDRSASANCGHWCSVASRLQRTHKRTLELRTYRAQGLYFLGLVEDLNGMSPSGLKVVRPISPSANTSPTRSCGPPSNDSLRGCGL